MKPRLLVVAEDATLRATLARCLLAAGYAVELGESAKRARDVLAAERIALAILAGDGPGAAELARELQDASVAVIAILEPEAIDKSAPSIPAHGYLFKPLKEQDVLARVKSLLPDPPKPDEQTGPPLLSFEGYTLDISGRACFDPSGAEVSLRRAEFSLLLVLLQRAGRVLSRDELRQAVLGRESDSDDRSVDMLVSRLRRKIEPDPKAPRLIVTVPGVGYKFGARAHAPSSMDEVTLTVATPPAAAPVGMPAVTGNQLVTAREASALEGRVPTSGAPEPSVPARPPDEARTISVPRWGMIGTAAVLVGVAGLLLILWRPFQPTNGTKATAALPRFDASLVPLVSDAVRQDLASYAANPDFKSLAISPTEAGNGWGVSFGASDAEGAKKDALERCSLRSKAGICRTYAIGMDVVWPPIVLPLPVPADMHTDPLDLPLPVKDIPILSDPLRRGISEQYLSATAPKALAVMRHEMRWNYALTRAEATRLAVERCGEAAQTACLLLSVDGLLTVQIPKSHVVEDFFMVTSEPGMSEQERDRVGQVYRGKEWRALARGKAGWYPVAELSSETSAVEAALAECTKRDHECRLYAIGNFRVGAEK